MITSLTNLTKLDNIAYELYTDNYISKTYDPLSLFSFHYIYYKKCSWGGTSYDDVKKIYDNAKITIRKLKLIEIENIKL